MGRLIYILQCKRQVWFINMTAEYILKHKEIPVMIFIMDDENYKLLDITEILQEDRLPFGLKDRGNKTQYAIQFNNWLTGRGISESRRDIANVKKIFNAKSSKELMIKAYGLNLTVFLLVFNDKCN